MVRADPAVFTGGRPGYEHHAYYMMKRPMGRLKRGGTQLVAFAVEL